MSALNGLGGIQVLYEEGGQVISATNYAAQGILTTDSIDVFLDIKPGTGVVTSSWEYTASDGKIYSGVGKAVTVTGDVLAAIRDNYTNNGVESGLAVGVISTHYNASSPIEASYDHFAVYAKPVSTSTLANASLTDPDSLLPAATNQQTSSPADHIDSAQGDGGYEDVDFEFIPDRALPGLALNTPGAIIVGGGGPLELDTTDVLLSHGNGFEDLRDIGPKTLKDIGSGVTKGVLCRYFCRRHTRKGKNLGRPVSVQASPGQAD